MQKIDVFIVYLSRESRAAYLYNILSQKDVMDPDDYLSSGFWGAYGGFEMVINDHYTILHVTDFHYLIKATSFLLHSLYWLANKKQDWFDQDHPDRIVLNTTKGDGVSLYRNKVNDIFISYTSVNPEHVKRRGDKFFNDFLIDEEKWIAAVTIALGEYFTLLKETISNSPDDSRNPTILKYLQVWEDIQKNQEF